MIENPFAEVDALYLEILSGSEDHLPVMSVLKILTPVIFSREHLSVDELEAFFGHKPGDIQLLLTDLASIVSIAEDADGFTRLSISHASFGEFLLDSARSKDLCISNRHIHTSIARRCFEILQIHGVLVLLIRSLDF